nr:MAG TPA: hypothetical protein [Caudoviricetes sp.]
MCLIFGRPLCLLILSDWHYIINNSVILTTE